MKIIDSFESLNSAYETIGLDSLNRRQVQGTLAQMHDGTFFEQPNRDQTATLCQFHQLYLGRGNGHWLLEDKGGVSPLFWKEFDDAIFDHLDRINGGRKWP